LRGPSDPDFVKLWSNPVLREWCIYNILQDLEEESAERELLLAAINPQLIKELNKRKTLSHKPPPGRVIKKSKQDPRVLESIKKYKQLQERWRDSDFSLDPNGEIDGGKCSNS